MIVGSSIDQLCSALVADLVGQPVLIDIGARGQRAAALVQRLSSGDSASAEDVMAALGTKTVARQPSLLAAQGGKRIAVVGLYGIATPRFHMPPYTYANFGLAATINDLTSDDTVSAICLDCDGPGGAVLGTPELNSAILSARARKPVVAHVVYSASANYYAASAADMIVITPSGSAGSIGCYVLHVEASRAFEAAGITAQYIFSKQSPNKTEGNPYEKLTPEAKAYEQKQVDAIGRDFINAVAVGRNKSASDVEMKFGGGRCLMAPDTVRVGMADAIGNFSKAIRAASSPSLARAARMARLSNESSRIDAGPAAARQRRLRLLRAT